MKPTFPIAVIIILVSQSPGHCDDAKVNEAPKSRFVGAWSDATLYIVTPEKYAGPRPLGSELYRDEFDCKLQRLGTAVVVIEGHGEGVFNPWSNDAKKITWEESGDQIAIESIDKKEKWLGIVRRDDTLVLRKITDRKYRGKTIEYVRVPAE